ncbi:hypothetical protein [Rhizobium alvei]|uniref:Uncharacterized protein n=1 Tax=Rhizobium alvei TaxID=1132659 RepID=A0ABT8YPW5_9HYPH|nr:hypothetical protein [Rhizobium alvei]MDO6965749.1 hypothetical protein [Rhizobium alvei]
MSMRKLAVFALVLVASAAQAADEQENLTGANGSTMTQLLSEGYEIKTAVPNGKRVIVFLQKDTNAAACELVSLTRARCGKLN